MQAPKIVTVHHFSIYRREHRDHRAQKQSIFKILIFLSGLGALCGERLRKNYDFLGVERC
jgi:hypothetical protein